MTENGNERLVPKIPDMVTEMLSDFEGRIARYQKETGERLKTTIAWLDAFNNLSMTFSLLVPVVHPARPIVDRIIKKSKTLHADDLDDSDKIELQEMIKELMEAVKE